MQESKKIEQKEYQKKKFCVEEGVLFREEN